MPPWVTLLITVVLPGLLGRLIGAVLSAHRLRRAIALLLGGIAVTVIGAEPNIA